MIGRSVCAAANDQLRAARERTASLTYRVSDENVQAGPCAAFRDYSVTPAVSVTDQRFREPQWGSAWTRTPGRGVRLRDIGGDLPR